MAPVGVVCPRRRPSVVSVAFEDTAWRSFVELLRCSPLSKVEMQGRYAHHRYRVQDDVFLGKDQVPPFSFRMVRRQGNSSWRCSSSKAVASVETRSCSRFRIGVYLCLVVVFVCRCGVVFLDSVVRNGLSFSCTQTSIFYKIKVRNCVLSKKKRAPRGSVFSVFRQIFIKSCKIHIFRSVWPNLVNFIFWKPLDL